MPRGIPNRTIDSPDFAITEERTLDFSTVRQASMRGLSVEVVSEREWRDQEEMAKFMAEPLKILIHETNDKNAPPFVEVAVNGEYACFPRNVPIANVPRYFVERLARSISRTVRTHETRDPRADEGYSYGITSGQDYTFSVLEDPNPRGRQWLNRVIKESR